MMNLFSALELGKNSLLAQQQVFHIIGHNIANVNTEGFSRQTPILENVAPGVIGFKSAGRGVQLSNVVSVRNRFLIDQIAARNQLDGKYTALNEAFATVEALFKESHGYGLSDVMTNFFNQWSDLADRPDDIPTREALVSSANSMCQLFNRTYLRLIEQQEVFNANIKDLTEDINVIAGNIADLNEKIVYANGSGASVHDLIDERDRLIKELSGKIGINTYFSENNDSVTVEVAGRPLVSYNTVNQLSVQKDPAAPNYYHVYMAQYGGTPVDITSEISNGKMEALILMRDTYIPEYKDELDNLAAGLISEVNNLHQQGFAYDGFTTGLNFFDMSTGPGTINAGGIVGTTVTVSGLAGNISNNLAVGDVVTINGQTRLVTAVTDPNQFVVDSAFNNDPVNGAPATWAVGWEYVNREGAASLFEVEASILNDSELVAASGNIYATTVVAGTGTVSSAGTTMTFTNNILAQGVTEGAVLDAGGQIRRIVSIAADGLSAVTDTAFAPALPGGTAWTFQNYAGAVGDNDTALSIAALMNQSNVVDGDVDGVNDQGTFHDYLHSTFAKIGNDSALAEYELEANKSMLNHLENKRDEISAVSLDEEAAMLIQFEKSYQAIAQYFGLINKLTDVLLSLGNT
jgi:flagellar hook-associated protein 1 FlgK